MINENSGGKHSFAPTIIIAVVYFASDFFLDGLYAAALIVAAGVLEYLYFRFLKNAEHPSVLVEGLVLGGIVLGSGFLEQTGYEGAEFPIIELILAGVLIISTLAGTPWLEGMMKRSPGISAGIDRFTSYCFGILFTVHGSVLAAMIIISHRIHIIPSVILFITLYVVAFIVVRKEYTKKAVLNTPILKDLADGNLELSVKGRILGVIWAEGDTVLTISRVSVEEDCKTHIFLSQLETALSIRGARTVKFTDWEGDTIQLEMSGYRKYESTWQKPIVK